MNSFSFDDIYEGLACSFVQKIDEQKMAAFQELSGDDNALHTDEGHAKEHGFQGRVVYGLLTSSFYSTLVGVHLPGKYALLQGLDILFSKPVYIGDCLTISGKVSYINEAYQQIEIKALIKNQHDEKVSKATIRVGFVNGSHG